MSYSIMQEYESIYDFYKPRSNDSESPPMSELCRHRGKQSSNFADCYDEVLSDIWMNFIYDYSVHKHQSKPWGVYITTADALDSSIDTETLKERLVVLASIIPRLSGDIATQRGQSH